MCNCENNSCYNQQEEEVEEFVITREYKIGEIFKIQNEIFKVVQGNKCDCPNCDLPYDFRCDSVCTQYERRDGEPIEFILYDTIPENE